MRKGNKFNYKHSLVTARLIILVLKHNQIYLVHFMVSRLVYSLSNHRKTPFGFPDINSDLSKLAKNQFGRKLNLSLDGEV